MKKSLAVNALLETVDFAGELLAHHQTYMAKPRSSLAGQHEEAHRRLQASAALVRAAEADDDYQGWSNRETWTVNLWLCNEPAPYAAMSEIIERDGLSPFERSDRLEEYTAARWSRGFTGWQSDMSQAFLARVNWLEIITSNTEA